MEIKLGKFEVKFIKSGIEVELDEETTVVLDPTLKYPVEVSLSRTPSYTRDVFSLLDIYNESLPDGTSLETPAIVSWEFDPHESGLPADPKDIYLGTVDDEGDFVRYSSQAVLPIPWGRMKKTALVYGFSPTEASPEQKRCKK
ncbi:MAG: hypothetical protein JXR96_08410 [Deltaproteobacteria bacterium]|nr:hypothetical protein [Deltaproteobacteria bacterium]